MIFPEAMTELAMYRRFVDAVKVPVLANITEFGATPLSPSTNCAAPAWPSRCIRFPPSGR
jgi:methylisocitrate lyase